MRDLPEAPALLALARDVLVNDLLPLLPPERRLDARLVANCLAIAEREAASDGPEWAGIIREVAILYRPESPSPPRVAGPPLSRIAGEGPSHSEGGEGAGRSEGGKGAAADSADPELLRRFARDLRIGDFANSPERMAPARAILWRLTIARLRLANPRFLAANGFS
jgi:hypothetical protein